MSVMCLQYMMRLCVELLYLALVLGDASERVEACVGIINDAPDRAM